MALSNDERGWIMSCISGVACVLGASIICADIIIRHFPGKKNFRIQDSDAFLSSSLSLSFGVMLFSSLYSMLPSGKKSLEEGGFSPKNAAWILIGCFLGGAIAIQFVSRILHHHMPTSVVDCEHNHDGEDVEGDNEAQHDDSHQHVNHDHEHEHHDQPKHHSHHNHPGANAKKEFGPHRPHLASGSKTTSHVPHQHQYHVDGESGREIEEDANAPTRTMASKRPSLHARLSQKISNMTLSNNKKPSCDCDGPCYGFSEPCGAECFKIVQTRAASFRLPHSRNSPIMKRHKSVNVSGLQSSESTPLLSNKSRRQDDTEGVFHSDSEDGHDHDHDHDQDHHHHNHENHGNHDEDHNDGSIPADQKNGDDKPQTHHHHHVPTNAFLSIGLQTSIAIALHKLPEGFITYATNHANPQLGFSVFLALFMHNITEGFAMALPLYLALNSRPKAMFWSFFLGGCSQPLGAGVAALWFKLAGNGNMKPGEGVYGGMFAVTAGIMASVALQLFSESLDLTHNRGLCMIFAFVGMGIMGVSSALTAA